MKQNKISAVIITLNEEANLDRCLNSLTWVDEVLIYDSGSTDRTLEIAQSKKNQLNIVIHQEEWLGFGATKRKAAELAHNNWILSLDADEEVSNELANEIKSFLISPLSQEIAKVGQSRLSYFMGKWIRHGGWFPDFQEKVFNKNFYQWNLAPIHEKIEPLESMIHHEVVKKTEQGNLKFKQPLFHYVFKDIAHQVQTNNRYSSLQAKDLFEKGRQFSYLDFFIKPYIKFIECYFFKLGFLDGWPGYIIARNAAYSMYLKIAKLKELCDFQKN